MREKFALLLILALCLSTALPAALATEALPELIVEEETENAETGVLRIPNGVTEIDDEAFYGGAFTEIIVPDSVSAIGDSAFADCGNLIYATIPGSVTSVGDGVLSGATADLYLYTDAGSAAQTYALNNNIDFNAETRYRALLIGNMYYDAGSMELDGPINDVEGLSACLTAFDTTPYQVTKLVEATGQEIRDAIADTFGDAGAQDVSLLYYSGHGALDDGSAAIIGSDMEYLYASDLRAALDQIPGRKIVLVDCCYSGGLLARTAKSALRASGASIETEYDADDFTSLFLQPFTRQKRSANTLSADKYFVITACAWDEESYEATIRGTIRGIFTYYVMLAWGYNGTSATSLRADANGNGVVTLAETSEYVAKWADKQADQSVQTWPTGCDWFGIVRQ